MLDVGNATGEKLSESPKIGISQPAGLSKTSLIFKPIPAKVTAAKNTWEAKIVEHTESKLSIDAGDQDALTAWDNKNKLLTDGHAAWKNAADKDAGGAEGQLDFSKTTRDAMLQKPIDDILRQNNLVELDVTGKIAKVLAGQEANVLALRARVIGTNAKAYKDVKDQPFQTKLAAQQAGIKTDTVAYVRKTVNKKGNPNIGSSNKKGFVPLAAGQTRTKEQLENGLKTGEYIPNQVVQYTNEEGDTRFGVITPYGVLG